MNRSPPPLRSAALSTNSTASQSASSRSTRRCMRSVSASRGCWTPGRSTRTSCHRSPSRPPVRCPDRAPRRLRLVRNDRAPSPDERVHERGLADIRTARDGDEPERVMSDRSCAITSVLQREHLAAVGLVIVTREVQHAVHDSLLEVLACARADHARRRARAGPRAGPAPSTGNDEHVGRASMPRCSRFSSWIRSASTSSTVRWPSSTPPPRAPPAPRRAARAGTRARPPQRFGAGGRARCAQLRARRLRVLGVGVHDPLHELVAHDVFAGEVHEVDVGHVVEDVAHHHETGALVAGRSIWVMSPVTTIFELKPSRVRNIFICSGVVFCASSRMMNESFSFGPA